MGLFRPVAGQLYFFSHMSSSGIMLTPSFLEISALIQMLKWAHMYTHTHTHTHTQHDDLINLLFYIFWKGTGLQNVQQSMVSTFFFIVFQMYWRD